MLRVGMVKAWPRDAMRKAAVKRGAELVKEKSTVPAARAIAERRESHLSFTSSWCCFCGWDDWRASLETLTEVLRRRKKERAGIIMKSTRIWIIADKESK